MTFNEEIKYFRDKFVLEAWKKQKRRVRYEPLRIIFYLGSPINLTSPWMMFDALVGRLLLMEALESDFYLLPTKFPFERAIKGASLPPFPIKITNDLCHCSISIFNPDSDRFSLGMIYKRYEERWSPARKKINTGSGFYRSYMIQNLYNSTSTVAFYMSADYGEIERLCPLIVSLGNDRRIGWGRVRGYGIQRESEDYGLIRERKAMRPIPIRFCEYYEEEVLLPWKSPYWSSDSVEKCVPPGAGVKLKTFLNIRST